MACSNGWHVLWTYFNRLTTDTIRIPRDALNEVVECDGGKVPRELIAREPRSDSTTVEVHRHALFTFLNAHGALRCDYEPDTQWDGIRIWRRPGTEPSR